MTSLSLPPSGLYRPEHEKDACGFGLIAHMDGGASHWLVETAVASLQRLTHRGAIAPDGKTGDGCGLLLRLPVPFFRRLAEGEGIRLADLFAVGTVFLCRDPEIAATARLNLEACLDDQGLAVAGWRPVPLDPSACGEEALESLPRIEQVLVNAPARMTRAVFERRLFLARRQAERRLAASDPAFFIAALSSRLVSYKGLVLPRNLPVLYPDLGAPDLESSLCVFHQRFSTNTWPEWRLAQPFRMLAHNGEINTLQGNRNWAAARAHVLTSPLLGAMEDLAPLVSGTGSDSFALDNMLELLVMGGLDLFQAMRLLVPPAWQNVQTMDADVRAFYELGSMHMEPWDGPAGIVLTDGRYAACVMDRNGLRPARYVVTRDRHITLASEVGVWDCRPEEVVVKGRLRPGEMLAADTETGELLLPERIDAHLKGLHPCRRWLHEHLVRVGSHLDDDPLCLEPLDPARLAVCEKLFLLSREERIQVIRVLADAGQEATGYPHRRIPLMQPRGESLVDALITICDAAVAAVREGNLILVLSDRALEPDRLPVNAILATGAVHHRLIADGLRCRANLLVDTALARDPHHFAVLIGYGATAVHPWLAYQALEDMVRRGEADGRPGVELGKAYRRGIVKGLYKILSKMGISSVASYRGAQLFEIVGLHREVVDLCWVRNDDRAVGARLAGEIARRHGNHGMRDAPVEVRLTGTAGQSVGACTPDGLHLTLIGDANDYVGKGMAGGRIVLRPPPEAHFAWREAVIMGNTCLYGSTGGRLFAAGQAGERFAVRNSGAVAVVEGVGDHGCEYMTGGVVVVLGEAGLNFGAGMTGGFAFVLDESGRFVDHFNPESVDLHRIDTVAMDAQAQFLSGLIAEHLGHTQSPWARQILDDFEAYLGRFWLVKPKAASVESLIAELEQAA